MYLIAGALSTSAFSQSDSKDRLPKAGDYGLGIDGVPVVDLFSIKREYSIIQLQHLQVICFHFISHSPFLVSTWLQIKKPSEVLLN